MSNMSDWKSKHVKGIGPVPCKVMLLGEAPGEIEDKTGIPFTGKTGKELDNTYLPLAGLERKNVHIDNVKQYHPPGNKTPSDAEILELADGAFKRIARVNPEYIIAAGYVPNKLFKPNEQFTLEKIHDRAYTYENKDYNIGPLTVIPTYHPAAGFRSGLFMRWCLDDFEAVGKYLRGELQLPLNPTRTGEYGIIRRESELIGVLTGAERVAIDTEDGPDGPWSIQIATCPQKGWFVYATEKRIVKYIFEWMYDTKPLLFIHHSLHDVAVMMQMGYKPHKFEGEIFDTLSQAAHLGNLPKSLKPLCYRLLNEEMDDYVDVVGPAMNQVAIEYLRKVAACQFEGLPPQKVWKKAKEDDWETLSTYKPQNLSKRIQRLVWEYDGYPEEHINKKLQEYQKKVIREYYGLKSVKRNEIDEYWESINPDGEYRHSEQINAIMDKYSGDTSINLQKRFSDMNNTDQAIELFGEMPRAWLKDIPEERAVAYAARDAMITFRIGELLYAND